MNFEIISAKTFRANGQEHTRNCFIRTGNNGTISIIRIHNQEIIADGVAVSDILINNEAMEDLEALRLVVFNRVCQCEKPLSKSRIFTETFSKIFN